MGKYNSINDAVRAKIDKLVEEKGLDKKDYLYTADVASSLNQLASIMGGSGDSMTIADSLYDVLDSADGAGGESGGDFTGLVDGTITQVNDSTVKSVRYTAFAGLESLESVSFTECTTIGEEAFMSCTNLTTASFPMCATIGISAFNYCSSLTTAYFPACTSLYSNAFMNCIGLTTANFPACTSLYSNVFMYCGNLTTTSFPTCTFIGGNAFMNCIGLTTANFPACTSLYSSVFMYCDNLTTTSFPTCTFIGGNAFMKCFNLATVSFPACTTIESFVFLSCYRLLSAYFLGSSVPTIGLNAFLSTPIDGYSASTDGVLGNIFVRASLLTSFQSAANWSAYSSRMVGLTDEEIAALDANN